MKINKKSRQNDAHPVVPRSRHAVGAYDEGNTV